MAAYRVRWRDPATGAVKARVFNTRREALRFAELPRPVPAQVQRLSERIADHG